MQSQTPPMTPFEQHISQSYQMLHMIRMQSAVMYHGVPFCMDKCLDTEELYTLRRTQHSPIKYRLKKDLEEKQCVEHCAIKWCQLLPMSMRETHDNATREVQLRAMMKMQGQLP